MVNGVVNASPSQPSANGWVLLRRMEKGLGCNSHGIYCLGACCFSTALTNLQIANRYSSVCAGEGLDVARRGCWCGEKQERPLTGRNAETSSSISLLHDILVSSASSRIVEWRRESAQVSENE